MLRGLILAAVLAAIAYTSFSGPAYAQSFVERNANAQGVTPPGEFQGRRGMQDNETSCGINPLLPRNIVCAWNSSAGSDGPIGDTWIRWSESIDGGEIFINQFINGSRLDPATSVGQDFAADPIVLCWPGGCGAIVIASKRAPGGGAGGGIYFQVAPDMNRDTGFRHALATTLDPVYLSTPTQFADKPYAAYLLDEENPGTVAVTYTVERPGGGSETIERNWPKARIIVAFALGDPETDEIKILSTYSDDYGGTWSLPVEVTSRGYWIDSIRVPNKCKKNPGQDECKEFLPSGLNQGINISAIGNNVLYTFRVFGDAEQPSAIQGVVSTDRGETLGQRFDLVSPLCAYDVPTMPNASNPNTAASRTNAFPWSSNNGQKHLLVYAERKPSSDGGCFTTFDAPTDSRIKAISIAADGSSWSQPVEIAPNPGHGFQFQPVADCSLGICQVAWWDSRFDTERVSHYLQNVSTSQMRSQALTAFLNLPVLGDFNFQTGPSTVMQFRRTARMLTTKVDISGALPIATDDPPAVVSKYRRALVEGAVREVERDGWNIKAYKTSTVPFMGDYGWLTSVLHRLVTVPGEPPAWEDNRSTDLLHPDKDPQFWVSFVTSRNVRGDIYTARISDPVPYDATPDDAVAARPADDEPASGGDPEGGETLHADAVEDFNPGAGFCAPTGNPGPGVTFDALNNRTKDFDIYGAMIESQVSAFSLNPTKTFNIQRAYTIVVENEATLPRSFRLVITNQPGGFPTTARASWDQLPFDPSDPDFSTTAPDVEEFVDVGPQSSESLALFVVSTEPVNPVSVDVFEVTATGEQLVNTITVDGVAEDGEFLNADGSVNDFEIHNPFVFFPTQFNPDEFNPDEYNPDEFNPDVYTPDEFNPDEFNPDEFNPDEFNPDEFNPDEFNPDEFNPDEFNPDEFNPDEFNAPLIDPAALDNPEIPPPSTATLPELVANFEINYGVRNTGNAITPYIVDFAYTDPEVLALFTSGKLVAQLIAWQDGKSEDAQFCAPREISLNRIIAVVNDPDLTTLRIPDINNNRNGAMTLWIAPDDVVQVTLRIVGPRALIVQYAPLLSAVNVSSMFASQVANTGETRLITNETLIIDDRTPPDFNFLPVDTTTFEAQGPGGVLLPADFVQAERGGVLVDNVVCDPALPAQIGLDIFNVPPGPTLINCTATTDNGVTADLSLSVFVLDTKPPSFDAATVPAGITVDADAAGSVVTYDLPTATDFNGVDPDVEVSCSPASGSVFPFTAPGPTATTVTCTATDDSLQTATATFGVTVQDVKAPAFTGGPLPDLTVEATALAGTIVDFTVTAFDAGDPSPMVSCSPASGSTFPLGTTVVSCSASDASGNSVSDSFDVTVEDTTGPTIGDFDPPEFDPPLVDRFVLADDRSTFRLYWGPFTVTDADAMPTVSCNVGILDPARSDPATGLYTFFHEFPIGQTLVECTATDAQGNQATASFPVVVYDETAPVITLLGDAEITVEQGTPYTDPGVSVSDNSTASGDIVVDIDTSDVDTDTEGRYTVTITATDASGNTATATRAVIVKFAYAGATGIVPKKLTVNLGSSNGLLWGWLDQAGNLVDASGDMQILRIREGSCAGPIVFEMAGDPGTSGFRFKNTFEIQFNWQVEGQAGRQYCAEAESSMTGQRQYSPLMTIE